MCDLGKNLKRKTATVYKVVADKGDGIYYSLAMGFRYAENKSVPVVKTQVRISTGFHPSILDNLAYRREMEGRTAGFVKLYSAYELYRKHEGFVTPHGYKCKIVKFILSDKLMSGDYQNAHPVIAGKFIDKIIPLEESEEKDLLFMKANDRRNNTMPNRGLWWQTV